MQRIGKGNLALIGSATTHTRNRDVNYPFRQDSDFYYLTGFNEPDSLAVFIPEREQGEYILFCREFDEKKAGFWFCRFEVSNEASRVFVRVQVPSSFPPSGFLPFTSM